MTIVFHERFLEHEQENVLHPERSERLSHIIRLLAAHELWTDVIEPTSAGRQDLMRIHESHYLDRLAYFGTGHWEPDTYVRPDTFKIAQLAAGGALLAAQTAWEQNKPVMALLRPPGHHALHDQAMGFCYLNNVAVAAAALAAHGAGRVAIVDLDVHHGNGTQEAFYDRKDVLAISIHQHPLFPGTGMVEETGVGAGEGYTVNLPLPPGSGDASFQEALDAVVFPIIRQYQPQILLVPFGTDVHYLDPMAAFTMGSAGFVHIMDRLRRLAREVCEGRMVCLLEGGYDLDALAECVAGVMGYWAGKKVPLQYNEETDHDCVARPVIQHAIEIHKQYWKL